MKNIVKFMSFTIASCLLIMALIPAAAVYASEVDTCWIEVECNVPDGFTENVGVIVMNNATQERYTITCRQVNEYVGRMEAPAGSYSIINTFTGSGAFSYDVVPSMTEFELVVDAPVATLIVLEVTSMEEAISQAAELESSESTEDPVSEEAQTSSDVEEKVTQEEETDSNQESKEPSASEPSTSTEETDATEIQEEPSEPTGFKRLALSLCGTAVFVGIVFLCVYLYRKYFY